MNVEEKNPVHPELQNAIDKTKEFQNKYNENVEKAAEESEDVKEGRCTKEDEINEPGNLLFNGISESSIAILQDPMLTQMFDVIAEKLGVEATKSLLTVLAVTMTNSAFHAVTFYDDLLKRELSNQFEHIGHHINLSKSDIESHKLLIEILRKQVGEINSQLKIEEYKDKNNIN